MSRDPQASRKDSPPAFAGAAADPEEALIQKALRGGKNAFSELVKRHQRVALSVAFGVVGDPHLAADVVQEAFVKAFQGLTQLRDRDRFRGWFLTIVRSTATDVVRRRVRWGTREVLIGDAGLDGFGSGGPSGPGGPRDPIASDSMGSGAYEPSPDDRVQQEEESERIREAIEGLPADYREVLLLKHSDGMSYRDIASLLQTSVRAVESRLFRARQQLQRLLKGEAGGSSADESSESSPSRPLPPKPISRRAEGSDGDA